MSPTSPMLIPFRRDRDRSRSPHPFPTPSQSPLNRVRQGLNSIRDKYNFIPKDKLDELLTRQTVKEITIQISNPVSGDQPRHLPANSFLYEDDYTRIHEKYRVILAILIELSWEEIFFKFHHYDYDDLRLPFTQRDLEHIDRDGKICPLFLKRQYEFLPRTIGGDSGEGRHSWTSEFVLPFISKTEIGDGGFSMVFKTKIYHLYDKINWTYFDDDRDHVYALKQLRDNSDEDAFMLEAFAGRLLGKRRHANLLPLLAYFKHGSSFNMIFPFADCDLMKYYKTRSPPKTAGERLNFMQHIHKLTSALKAIHMGDPDQTSELVVVCGYHRDLKPQNILIFDGNFMIADFGLTRFRERNPHDQENTGVDWDLGSSTYRAPECDKAGVVKVGRAGDVWSLGCILAEVIVFVLCGNDGVRSFMECRKMGHNDTQISERERLPDNRRARDWFHDGDHVKPQVLTWFQHLIERTKGDYFVVEFVCLLEKMLQSHPDDRLKIADVESEFDDILCREATRLNPVSTTTETAMAVTCVAERGGSTIKKVTTERKTTISAQYGEPLGIRRVTTERKTTESVSAAASGSYAGSFLGGLRVMIPWGRTEPVTTSGGNNPSARPRAASNVGISEPSAPHSRSYSVPGGLGPRNNNDLKLMGNSILPPTQYSASPLEVQQEFPSSTYGSTDPQTPNQQNRARHSEDSTLSPEFVSRHSVSGIATLGSSRRASLAPSPLIREATDPWRSLALLRTFDTMFLIDDSDDIRDWWPATQRSLIRFAELATRYDKDGIDLAFIHSDAEYRGITSDRLNEIMEDVEREVLQGVPGSSMAISLDRHLNEYTRKYEESRSHGPGHRCKYLNLIVLTSRDPGYMDGFDDTVLSYAQQLDDLHAPKFQLGIQFALIQSEPKDRVRFKRLDDQEGRYKTVRDIVDATPYDPDTDEDNAEILVKVLCGAINPRLDNLELTPDTPTPQAGSPHSTTSSTASPRTNRRRS